MKNPPANAAAGRRDAIFFTRIGPLISQCQCVIEGALTITPK